MAADPLVGTLVVQQPVVRQGKADEGGDTAYGVSRAARHNGPNMH